MNAEEIDAIETLEQHMRNVAHIADDACKEVVEIVREAHSSLRERQHELKLADKAGYNETKKRVHRAIEKPEYTVLEIEDFDKTDAPQEVRPELFPLEHAQALLPHMALIDSVRQALNPMYDQLLELTRVEQIQEGEDKSALVVIAHIYQWRLGVSYRTKGEDTGKDWTEVFNLKKEENEKFRKCLDWIAQFPYDVFSASNPSGIVLFEDMLLKAGDIELHKAREEAARNYAFTCPEPTEFEIFIGRMLDSDVRIPAEQYAEHCGDCKNRERCPAGPYKP